MADQSAQEKGGLHQYDETSMGQVSAPRQGGRVKAFLRRWWWLLLIVFVVVVLVVVLPLIFVGIPNIAQSEVNKASLEINKQVVSNPKPDSVDLQLSSTASSNSSFHPELDSFQAALFLEDTEPNIKPFAYVTIPKTKVSKKMVLDVDQTLNVVDMDQFKAYNRLVVQSETFRLAVRGKVALKMPGLSAFDVDFNKAVEMKGLNGLAGFNVQSITIMLKPEADGTNMVGKVFVPNPSVMTLSLGNVTMDLFVDGTPIGQSLIPDLTLKPGDNLFDMRAVTNQSAVIGLITSKYKNAVLPIDVIGNSSINSAGEHLPYFESAIQSNKMRMNLDVGQALANIGLNLTGL